MASGVPLKKMKRSKSLNSLGESEYRWENDFNKSNVGDDSGVQADGFVGSERRVDKLIDICTGLRRKVSEMAALVANSGWGRRAGDDGGRELDRAGLRLHDLIEDREQSAESGARSLLNAIEARPSLKRRVGAAVTGLLQSEEVKQRIVSAAAAAIKEQVTSMIRAEMSSLFVPVVRRAHRLLLKRITMMVTAEFANLKENTARSDEAWQEVSQSLLAGLKKHESLLLQACGNSSSLVDADEVIDCDESSNDMPPVSECDSAPVDSPAPPSCASAEALANTQLSPVDPMMITAEVTKLIQEGDVNGAFTRALHAGDLAVAVAACRAAVLPVPALEQPVLLSLLQQLTTDLLIDTTLQCSYIEYALWSLDPTDEVTRAHLPFVIGEVQRHLSAFLQNYPHHVHAHRISAIIDTARRLL